MNKVGFVYIVRHPGTSNYKIGFTRSPKTRISDMRTSNPFLSITHIHVGTMGDEKFMHKKYGHCKISREWFLLSKDQISEISAYFFDKYMSSPEMYFNILSESVATLANGAFENDSANSLKYFLSEKKTYPPERSKAIAESAGLEITDFEKSELQRINVSGKSARAIKYVWQKDIYAPTSDVSRLSGFSESLCQKVLSIMRRSAENER